MSAEVLLNALDDLYGQAPVSPASAGSQARTLTNPALPASWQSPAAVGLDNRQRDLDNARGSFAAADDNTKNQLDQANTAVKDGKKQLGDIKDNYRLNKARLSGMDSPELAAKRDELDRVRSQDGVNTVRGTQARLPNMAGAGMNPLMSAMPAAMAPAAALPQMLNTPMQAFSPLTSALQGLTIPQQVTHALPTNGPTDGGTRAELAGATVTGNGPPAIRAAIEKALDIKGIKDPRARQLWAAGLTTIASRESNFNVDAVNNWDINAKKGTPSEGAWQMIDPTFRSYHEPGTSTYLRDPVAQACAVINYVKGRYGVLDDASNFAARVQQADPSRSPKGY